MSAIHRWLAAIDTDTGGDITQGTNGRVRTDVMGVLAITTNVDLSSVLALFTTDTPLLFACANHLQATNRRIRIEVMCALTINLPLAPEALTEVAITDSSSVFALLTTDALHASNGRIRTEVMGVCTISLPRVPEAPTDVAITVLSFVFALITTDTPLLFARATKRSALYPRATTAVVLIRTQELEVWASPCRV